jgi:hypothetical protein
MGIIDGQKRARNKQGSLLLEKGAHKNQFKKITPQTFGGEEKSKTMKRVIKFRAWDGKKFIYPSVIGTLLEDFAWEHDRGYIHDCQQWGSEDGFIMGPVLEQFTGLLDKNGKEIFENDLIELFGNKNGAFQVEFKNAYVGGWILTSPISKDHLSLGARKIEELEIIGSIHQNPELLT